MKRVLILGGGFGGVATALRLREKLAQEDEILVVDRRNYFMVGFRKTWALVGEETLAAGQGDLAALKRKGIQFVRGTITRIDAPNRAVEVDGRRIEADAVVVALGTALAPDEIPGLSNHGFNVYDPQTIPQAAEALRQFAGGRVLVGVFGTPYKCPPAPYEIAIKVNEFLKRRSVEASVEVVTPLPMSLPILGQSGCNVIEGRLAGHGIGFLPSHTTTAVEAGEVVFTTGRRKYDLLLAVPPHRAPAVVIESGLTDGGNWVRVNPETVETQFSGVYAIGDVVEIPMANGKPLPKAGVFAEAMGYVAADRIAALFAGQTPDAVFEGQGGCFLEVGNDQAVMVEGSFLAKPAPEVRLTDASQEYLQRKRTFEAERLKDWFG